MPTTTITYTEKDIIDLLAKEHDVDAERVHVEITPEYDDGPNRCTKATFSLSVDLKIKATRRTSNLP